jgi:hypothetical protein
MSVIAPTLFETHTDDMVDREVGRFGAGEARANKRERIYIPVKLKFILATTFATC